ncbi:hypothetical protein F4823DRAFT_562840 [Ustulina deusta]|nr:hypothetical protein F4823DRAFT_562840 [Ustulina deusta]
MPLPPHLARSLRGRRPIDLTDGASEDSSANAFQAEEALPRSQIQTSSRASSQPRPRPFTTSAPSSSDFYSVGQPLFVQTGYHPDYSSPFVLEPPQSTLGYPLASGRGVMTGVVNSAAPPSIMIESYDQQDALPRPLPLQPGGGQLAPSGFGTLNQSVPGIGQQHYQTPSNSSNRQLFLLVESGPPRVGTIDMTIPNSGIYWDEIEGTDLEGLVHPSPPGRIAITVMGYHPAGGDSIHLTLRNTARRDVPLLLTIIRRDLPIDRRDGLEVALVLGRDYLDALAHPRRISLGNMQFPNPDHQAWQMPGRPRNASIAPQTLGFESGHQNDSGFISPVWTSGSNQTQGLHPHYPATPSYMTMSSSQGSSVLAASSTTSPDGPYIPMPSQREYDLG